MKENWYYNITMKQGPPQGPPSISSPESESRLLTRKEFCSLDSLGMPRYLNFSGYFAIGPVAEVLRQQRHYQRFAQKYPKLNERLCSKIQKRDTAQAIYEFLKPLEDDLYEAYKIMCTYGVSNNDLLSL